MHLTRACRVNNFILLDITQNSGRSDEIRWFSLEKIHCLVYIFFSSVWVPGKQTPDWPQRCRVIGVKTVKGEAGVRAGGSLGRTRVCGSKVGEGLCWREPQRLLEPPSRSALERPVQSVGVTQGTEGSFVSPDRGTVCFPSLLSCQKGLPVERVAGHPDEMRVRLPSVSTNRAGELAGEASAPKRRSQR